MAGSLILWMCMLAGAEPPDTLVVVPRDFRNALQPWVQHRTAQGHRLGFMNNDVSAEQIRAAVRAGVESGQLHWVVLVGDAEPSEPSGKRAWCTPTQHVAAQVNVQFGSEPEIASDNWFADVDDDDLPDVAIGRITADTPEELSRIVRKILAYEQAANFGMWRQRINFVAGVGGFGSLADTVVETATKKFLTDGIPPSYTTTMTYGSWRSPFCPDPRRFHETAVQRINEGCLYWVYIGHGQQMELDRIRVPGGLFPILSTRDMPQLGGDAGSPIAIFLACYTGAFDKSRDCLAEEMLRAPGGPVAILCGSRVTMPYGMAVLGTCLMEECFHQQRETLGEMLLMAKRRTMQVEPDNLNRQMLDALAKMLSPAGDKLTEERAEHLYLFNLIGDPLLRVKRPMEVKLDTLEDLSAGQRAAIAGESPIAGKCTVELVCRRDQLRKDSPARNAFSGDAKSLAAYTETYQQANDRRWAMHSLDISPGAFQSELLIPEDASGPCHVRVYVEGKDQHALGSTNVFVRRK